jgi:hypothetical protein
MVQGRTHDLDFSIEVTNPGSGVIASNFEKAFVVLPRHVVKDDDVVGIGRRVVFA